MKKLGIVSLLGAFVASSIVMFATSAWAVPVFARKYNVACSLCHTIPPRLTKAGVAFKENGFEMPSGLPQSDRFANAVLAEDEPKAEVPAGLPLTLRTGANLAITQTQSGTTGFVAQTSALTINPREFGLIGGGNLGGVGFWIDAPFAGAGGAMAPATVLNASGAAVGTVNVPANTYAIFADYKFADLAKIRGGIFQPNATINYGLGLQPMAIDPANRNPVAMLASGALAFGDSTATGLELRGTTDATNGLAFNYSIGYSFNAANADNNPFAGNLIPAGGVTESAFYGGLGYLVDAINTYLGVSYAASTNVGTLKNNNGNTLLATATYNPGEAFEVIFAYNTTNGAAVAPAASVNANGWSIQPEYSFGNWWIGARYASLTNADTVVTSFVGAPVVPTAAVNSSQINAGIGYRVLQNILLTATYINATNNTAVAASKKSADGVALGLDLIL